MFLREMTEELERQTLSPYAALSADSRGRQRPMEPCQIRTCYQRDIDRILHSKSFRRLMHKTQVFLQPEGDHYRTRMTHTLEVVRISRTIARGLRLNEDLTEAIALGHDLGHTPFGHAGERVLNEILPGGFRHNEQSLRVVDRLEIGSYILFVGQATEAEVLADGSMLTLEEFTTGGKQATPPAATVYRSVEINGYRCTICGYVHEAESLPADFICPICRATADKFEKIEK